MSMLPSGGEDPIPPMQAHIATRAIPRWAKAVGVERGSEEYQLAGTWLMSMAKRSTLAEPVLDIATALSTARRWPELTPHQVVGLVAQCLTFGIVTPTGDTAHDALWVTLSRVAVITGKRRALLFAAACLTDAAAERLRPWHLAALNDREFSEASRAWGEVWLAVSAACAGDTPPMFICDVPRVGDVVFRKFPNIDH